VFLKRHAPLSASAERSAAGHALQSMMAAILLSLAFPSNLFARCFGLLAAP
jgi:hypothetical protein